MSLQRFLAGLSLAAILSPPAGLQAQIAGTGATNPLSSGGISVLVTSVGDQTNRQVGLVYLGVAQCTANVPVTFELSTVPAGKSIDVYWGENCNAATRTATTGEGCTFIENFTVRTTLRMDVTIGAASLFVSGCDANSENKPNIWFLPVNTSRGSEAVSVYGRFQGISADAQPPLAPTGLDAGKGGERQIGLHWNTAEPASAIDKIYIFIDAAPSGSSTSQESTSGATTDAGTGGAGGAAGNASTGGAGGAAADGGTAGAGGATTAETPTPSDCFSSALTEGKAPPAIDALPTGVSVKVLNNGAQLSDNIDPQQYGLGRDPAAVAVANVDFAGNVSLTSNVVCAYAIPTTGFGDALHQDFGKDVEGCPCSAFGTTQLQSSWPIGLSLCALAFSARRRRTR